MAEKTITSLGLTEFAELKYITPKAEFAVTDGGILRMKWDDTEYPRVTLHRIFPFSTSDHYISVQDKENNEIGIIENMADFPADVQEIMVSQINLRYFAPVIQSITSVKEDFGYLLWTVETDVGTMVFTSQTSQGMMVQVADNHYLIIDLDGNRFEIPDLRKLSKKDVYKIEMYI